MNPLLQQLIGMAPGIGAAVGGDGNAFASFMEGYQRTMQQLEQRKRLQQQDSIALEDRDLRQQDRQAQMTRQQAQDARAGEDQAWQQQQRLISLGQLLEQSGAAADTLPEAEGAIDSTFGMLTPEQQAKLGAKRDASLRGAVGKISSRQKAELKRWVAEDLMRSRFVAEHTDADPDVTQAMPARMRQLAEALTGKTEFRKSDLLSLTETMEQAKAEKTRIPAAAGSMEEFSDPNITPERKAQILADRKAYMQSDDRAPRVTVNTGGMDPKALARFNAIASAYDRSPLIRAADRTLPLADAAKTIRKDPKNAAAQMALAYGFIQALDTYQSAVREGELGNLGSLGTVLQQLGVSANKLVTTGAFMPPKVALQIANSSDELVRVIEQGRQQKMGEFASRAKVNKVDDLWGEFVAGMPQRAQTGAAPGALAPRISAGAKVGDTVRNKKTGELSEVTAIRPDGSLVLKPKP